jgi:hypothetical protein
MKRRDEYLSDSCILPTVSEPESTYISREKHQNKAAFMIILVKNKILFVFYHEKKKSRFYREYIDVQHPQITVNDIRKSNHMFSPRILKYLSFMNTPLIY